MSRFENVVAALTNNEHCSVLVDRLFPNEDTIICEGVDPLEYDFDTCEFTDFPDGWNVLYGASNQDRYAGPIMHESETLSAGMIETIMRLTSTRFVYVTTTYVPDPEDNEVAGWVTLYR